MCPLLDQISVILSFINENSTFFQLLFNFSLSFDFETKWRSISAGYDSRLDNANFIFGFCSKGSFTNYVYKICLFLTTKPPPHSAVVQPTNRVGTLGYDLV